MREDLIVSLYSNKYNIKVLLKDLLKELNKPVKILRVDRLNQDKDSIVYYLDTFGCMGKNTVIEEYEGEGVCTSTKLNSTKRNRYKKKKEEISEVLKLIPEEYKLGDEFDKVYYLSSFLYSLCFRDNKKRSNMIIIDDHSKQLELIKSNKELFNKTNVYKCNGDKLIKI